jgi:hypothetical protein
MCVGVWWSVIVCARVWWSVLECVGVCWSVLKCTGALYCIPFYSSTFWHSLSNSIASFKQTQIVYEGEYFPPNQAVTETIWL